MLKFYKKAHQWQYSVQGTLHLYFQTYGITQISRSKSIFLNNIYSCYYSEVKINLKNIFPDIDENQKIFASWINGDLYLPQGSLIIL